MENRDITRHLQNTILSCSDALDSCTNYQIALQDYAEACRLPSSDCNIDDAASKFMKTLAARYFRVVSENIPTKFSLTERDLFLCHSKRLPHAMDFLKAILISGLGQAVGPRQFRVVLQYRLGIPFFNDDSLCSSCNKLMDAFGDHALHCAKDIGIKYRHDIARDALADICYKANVPSRKEASLGLRSDSAKDLKPSDILVLNWEGGKYVCFDVTVVSPFTSAGTRGFTPGHAISMAITRKCNKYLEKCSTHGYGFGVLAFSTLGELGEDTVAFLKMLGNCLTSHDANHKIGGALFHRLRIIIQKGVGAQLVTRLSSTKL